MDSILPDIPVWAALALLNLGAFLAFWIDKRQAAQGGTRIEEHRLILLSVIGGSLGAKLGQVLLRHKSSKGNFRHILTGILAVHVVIALLILR
jgi:uncharacterized membrane protein YsdA (DUF1294 family)